MPDAFHEAEDFTAASGCSVASNHAGYTGTGFVDMGGDGTWFEWNTIYGGNGGDCTLTFRYALGSGGRSCEISVNGIPAGTVSFPGTGGWDIWSTDTLGVTLTGGTNTIRVTANSAGGPNVDNMDIAGAGPDTDPPTPDPATFASPPAADSDTAISMTATTGSDASGPVEYLFDETSGNPGGSDSGWQTSSSYTDTGLSPSTQYTYTVTMRDSLGNTGTASDPANATTQAAPDTDPPTPNPATFASAPSADSDTAISMTATTGSDTTGPVEYYFDEISGNPGGTDSGWQTSPSYTDTGLNPSTQYTYTVTMRDSVTPTPNMGTPSSPANATTDPAPDTDPPTPNPATFASAPAADSSSAISMTATTGSDASGPVEYFFDETSGNPGGTDSGWQTSASYTDSGLDAGTQYTYTVTMRDSLANTGTASNPASATTMGGATVDDFNVSEDAYVKQKKATTNYGDASVLRVRSSSTKQIDSYLKFTVSGVGTVTSAKLKLWSIDVNMGVDVYQAASTSWSEGSIIWNTAPGTTGGVLDSVAVTTGWTEFDVTGAISGDGTYSFVLQGDTDATGRDFSSSEGSYMPVLTITHQ